jgi:hypothetical protein
VEQAIRDEPRGVLRSGQQTVLKAASQAWLRMKHLNQRLARGFAGELTGVPDAILA